jgi:hypothetical protein
MEDNHEFALYCPITYKIFEDPVKAEDGRTYERDGIEAWFESCRKRNIAITSPWTRLEMGTGLETNSEAAAQARRLREELLHRSGSADDNAPADSPHASQACDLRAALSSVSSIHNLRKVFAILDPLRGILEKSLDGWQPPQVVVFGEENSGKSSVLERLAMMPIFPRNNRLCTRLPIHVRLRNADKCSPATLEV